MSILGFIRDVLITGYEVTKASEADTGKYPHEFCPRCDANITLQKGYSNELPYWICKGCREMLINPANPDDSNIVWLCDGCGEMLNSQEGFYDNCGIFKCTCCGYENKINENEIYLSEEEYQVDARSPYKDLSNEDMLELSLYEEIEPIAGREDIILVMDPETGKRYVKKILTQYDVSVYDFLKEHPVKGMPRLFGVYESKNNLIIIEEYIEGKTVKELIECGKISKEKALYITECLCLILNKLHTLDKPIIHRDIKPSNIIIGRNDEVYLLDINVAKWYKEEAEDTKLMGTLYYAAPEQFGYGFKGSTTKSDIYALGILMNVMLTGKIPKEKKAEGPLWEVIEKCISFEPDKRYTAMELYEELKGLED